MLPTPKFLKMPAMLEVLTSPEHRNLFIGGYVDLGEEKIVLIRGNFDYVVRSFDQFMPSPDGMMPDFKDFEVIDAGQTVRFGRYEVATNTIL